MNAVRITRMLLGMLIHTNMMWCMESSSSSSNGSADQQMAQLSYSLRVVKQELADLNAWQIRDASTQSVPSRLQDATLEKLVGMRASVAHVRSSLDSKAQETRADTDIVRGVQAVMHYVDGQLTSAHEALSSYADVPTYRRQQVLNTALSPLYEIDVCVHDLFDICDNHAYVSHDKKRHNGITRTPMSMMINDCIINSIRSAVIDTASSEKWYERWYKKLANYKSLYDEMHVRRAVGLAQTDPHNITYVLEDLSYRLCSSEEYTHFCNDMQKKLDLIGNVCGACSDIAPTLRAMRADNDLQAQKVEKILRAATGIIAGGSLLRSVETIAVNASTEGQGITGRIKQVASSVAAEGLKQAGLTNQKQLDSLAEHAKKGVPRSQYLQRLTDFIVRYKISWLTDTAIEVLHNHGDSVTTLMHIAADQCIASEPDCARIRDMINQLRAIQQQGGESALHRERNKGLLAHLMLLKNAWEKPAEYAIIGGDADETRSNDSFHTARQEWDLEDEAALADSDKGQASTLGADDFDVWPLETVLKRVCQEGADAQSPGSSPGNSYPDSHTDYDLEFRRALSGTSDSHEDVPDTDSE